MSAFSHGSGPRSNAYSVNKFTNQTIFNPFTLEMETVWRRFDRRIALKPSKPLVIALPPARDFQQPCNEMDIRAKLARVQPEFLVDLRAIFVLSGTQKQLRTWRSKVALVGCYWRRCVFLYAYPWMGRMNLDQMRQFYVHDVLLHEIGHHVDRFRHADHATKEGFANWFPIGHDRVHAGEIIPFTPEAAQPKLHEHLLVEDDPVAGS